jgi:hypothetical protein
MPNLSTIKTTTRHTAPEPTGTEKWLQDLWDTRRNTQVKTFMKLETKVAVLNYALTLRRAIDDMVAREDKQMMCDAYGSYVRTDRYEADGETVNKANNDFFTTYPRRIGHDHTEATTKYAASKGIRITATGIRVTGCLEFEDGTLEPVDPTTGFRLQGVAPKAIHSVETMYCVLIKDPNFEKWCCFCGDEVGKYGNNPEPIMDGVKWKCCDECNTTKVIPARMAYSGFKVKTK